MINHNLILYDLLDRKFESMFQGHTYIVNYTEGDLFELSKKLQDSQTKYPIIWLQTGYKVERNKQSNMTSLQDCKFFFITKGSGTDRYKKRYESTYNDILYSCLKKFDDSIRKKKGISTKNVDTFTTFPFNDTTELTRRDNINGTKTPNQTVTVVDIWDALLLETDITISNECFSQFIIK